MKKLNNYSLKKKKLITLINKVFFINFQKIIFFLKYLFFKKRSINIFLCLNNYSFYLSQSYISQNKESFNLIFYDQDRSFISQKISNIIFFKYNYFLNRIILLIICFRVKPENIFLPHNRGGAIQKFISRKFIFSILEDGLDSYRKHPKN